MKDPHYIIDAGGNYTAVVLDLATYRELLERLAAAEQPHHTATVDDPAFSPSTTTTRDEGHKEGSLVGTSGADLVALLQTLTFDATGLDEMERIIEEDCERIDPHDW